MSVGNQGLSGNKGYLFVLYLVLAFLPFELLISQVTHGFLKNYVPVPSLLFHPFVFFAAIVLAGGLLSIGSVNKVDRPVLISLIMMAIPSAFHIARGGVLDISFLALGVGPLLFGVLLAKFSHKINYFYKIICFGVTAWCLVVIVIWLVDAFRFIYSNDWARLYDWDQLIVVMRYPDSIDLNLYYPFVVGNWNKASNFLVLASLIAVLAIYKNKNIATCCLAIFCVAMVIFLSFSRGSMLVFAGVGVSLLACSFRWGIRERPVWVIIFFIMVLPLVVSLSLEHMRFAWFDVSSNNERIRQLAELAQSTKGESSQLSEWLLGGGVGAYGRTQFGSSFAGTHNLFVDIFLAGGVVQLVGLLSLFIFALYSATRGGWSMGSQVIGGLAVVAVILLSLREFDLNYLGVTSLPSLLLGYLLGASLGYLENDLVIGEART